MTRHLGGTDHAGYEWSVPRQRGYLPPSVDGIGFISLAGRALFVGPTFYAKLSKQWWASVAWSVQVGGRAADQPGAFDLVNFERHTFLLRFGYHF